MFVERDLPPRGETPRAARAVQWPTTCEPLPWVCLIPVPRIFATHWCPGLAERGAQSKGRSVPCLADGCPRCLDPRRYPPQGVLVFPCLTPAGELAVCICPERVASYVQSNAALRQDWLGARLWLSRAHRGRSGAVTLTALDYVESEELPHGLDMWAALRRLWAPYLPAGWNGILPSQELTDRDPGQEG
jgi:hypothetical protein